MILPTAFVRAGKYDGLRRRLANYRLAIAIPKCRSRLKSPLSTQTAIDKSNEASLDYSRFKVRSSQELVTSVGDLLADCPHHV